MQQSRETPASICIRTNSPVDLGLPCPVYIRTSKARWSVASKRNKPSCARECHYAAHFPALIKWHAKFAQKTRPRLSENFLKAPCWDGSTVNLERVLTRSATSNEVRVKFECEFRDILENFSDENAEKFTPVCDIKYEQYKSRKISSN